MLSLLVIVLLIIILLGVNSTKIFHRVSNQLGQVSCQHSPDPGGGEGALQSTQDQGQHSQIWQVAVIFILFGKIRIHFFITIFVLQA